MNLKTRSVRILIKGLLICFIVVSFQQSVLAGMIPTSDLVDEQFAVSEKMRLSQLLSSEEVQSQLVALGVDPADAQQRIANMTDEEVISFASDMDEMQAGSGVLGLAVFVFLVLLVTDLLGYTDIFPFVKKTVK